MEETPKNHVNNSTPIPFKAETRKILDILIHSLYSEREIFLRELISNAADALTRMNFEMLTNRDVLNPEAELAIWITTNSEEKIITITDSGIGMTAEELSENLGTIAHSGARAFLDASKQLDEENRYKLSDIIGLFGVGFYSAFMVAEWIRVTSRSYQVIADASTWYSTGADTFTIEPAEKSGRGTSVAIKLKEDAYEFLEPHRLREIIRKHSDFIPYPIYLDVKGEGEVDQVNRQVALWRQPPRQVEPKDYDDFYKQLTLEAETPVTYAHMVVDAPVQLYALLFIPAKFERGLFTLRKEDGLKLYARKVLIQDYCKDLLPEYFQFIQGIVDSEDLPLNVSRETVQSNKVIGQIKKLLTGKVIETLKKFGDEQHESYQNFWKEFGHFIKQGIAIEQNEVEALYPLVRFHTSMYPAVWSTLDDYIHRMPEEQKEIYFILGEDERSIQLSPHLDAIRKNGYDTLLLTHPVDPFMMVRLTNYQGHPLKNIASADLKLPKKPAGEQSELGEQEKSGLPSESWGVLIDRFKRCLGDQVSDVRMTDRLIESPARLVDPEGSPSPELQRVYRFLKEDFAQTKKVLELNPKHALIYRLATVPEDASLSNLVIEQIYQNALVMEGLQPDPASMVERIQEIMGAALGS